LLVWIYEYAGSFAQATRNGYAGFIIFHVALVLIVVSALRPSISPLIVPAFLIVCVGAVGAVHRYEEVSIYRWLVILIAAGGVLASCYGWDNRLGRGS
jgi:hypothetical protein